MAQATASDHTDGERFHPDEVEKWEEEEEAGLYTRASLLKSTITSLAVKGEGGGRDPNRSCPSSSPKWSPGWNSQLLGPPLVVQVVVQNGVRAGIHSRWVLPSDLLFHSAERLRWAKTLISELAELSSFWPRPFLVKIPCWLPEVDLCCCQHALGTMYSG